jgi:hypothetical protein
VQNVLLGFRPSCYSVSLSNYQLKRDGICVSPPCFSWVYPCDTRPPVALDVEEADIFHRDGETYREAPARLLGRAKCCIMAAIKAVAPLASAPTLSTAPTAAWSALP